MTCKSSALRHADVSIVTFAGVTSQTAGPSGQPGPLRLRAVSIPKLCGSSPGWSGAPGQLLTPAPLRLGCLHLGQCRRRGHGHFDLPLCPPAQPVLRSKLPPKFLAMVEKHPFSSREKSAQRLPLLLLFASDNTGAQGKLLSAQPALATALKRPLLCGEPELGGWTPYLHVAGAPPEPREWFTLSSTLAGNRWSRLRSSPESC